MDWEAPDRNGRDGSARQRKANASVTGGNVGAPTRVQRAASEPVEWNGAERKPAELIGLRGIGAQSAESKYFGTSGDTGAVSSAFPECVRNGGEESRADDVAGLDGIGAGWRGIEPSQGDGDGLRLKALQWKERRWPPACIAGGHSFFKSRQCIVFVINEATIPSLQIHQPTPMPITKASSLSSHSTALTAPECRLGPAKLACRRGGPHRRTAASRTRGRVVPAVHACVCARVVAACVVAAFGCW